MLDTGVFANDGALATHINSTYDIRQFNSDATNHLWRPGITAGRNIIVKAAESNAAKDADASEKAKPAAAR